MENINDTWIKNHAEILIVDDNRNNILLLESVLKAVGYKKITSTSRSLDVVDMLMNNHYDLLLLDLQMPDKNGFDILTDIEANKILVPVVVLTASSDDKFRHKAIEMGAKDFLTKPFNPKETIKRVHNILNIYILYNQKVITEEHLEKEIEKRTAELEQTQVQLIRALSLAGEYRDNETSKHVIRMSKVCGYISGKLNYIDPLVMEQASSMHDLGKIGIPDNILLKKGQLTHDEMNVMKQHTLIGSDILSVVTNEIAVIAKNIALSHHEKWDGSGYPHNLSNIEIPLEARINTISDVFDALLSKRPYKEPWTIDEAVNFLKENSGLIFDPSLVELFIENLDEIIILRNKYLD